MTASSIPIDVVRANILHTNGEAGRAWLDALPRIVAELQVRWSLTLSRPFEGGSAAHIVPAITADGTRAVLKVSFVDEETRHEADALALWDGDGAVRLLDADPERGALLLERLEPGTSLLTHPDRDEAISLACGLLRRLWRPLPDLHPFPLVGDFARRLAEELPPAAERVGGSLDRALALEAAAISAELAHSAKEPVLANRDFHLGNVLAATRAPWLAIDPKPLAGEPAFDTGAFLRSLLPDELDGAEVRRLVRRLADELDLERERVRAWAFVRAVDDMVWSLGIDQAADVGWDLECARLLARA